MLSTDRRTWLLSADELSASLLHPWTLLLTVPLAITIRCGVGAREEAYLERRFGDACRDYKRRVRRWL
jgi:protein-S-isoprenylcysteine O-methyltransferase Ste14